MAIYRRMHPSLLLTFLLVVKVFVFTFENRMLQQESSLPPMSTEQPGLERPRTYEKTPPTGTSNRYTPFNFSMMSEDIQIVTNGTTNSEREIDSVTCFGSRGCLENTVNASRFTMPHSLLENAVDSTDKYDNTSAYPFLHVNLNNLGRGADKTQYSHENFSEVFTSLNLKMTTESHPNVTDVTTARVIDPSKRLRQSEERTGSKPMSASVTATVTTNTDSMTGRYAEANTVIGSGLTTGMMSADSTEELSIAELDTILTYTCKDRCSQDMPFPCSCATICVVYNTCCENITLDCPHIVQEGLARFDHLVNTDKVCSENYVYIIASCPEHEDKNITQNNSNFSGFLDSEKQGLAESKSHDNWMDKHIKFVQNQNGVTHPTTPDMSDEGEETRTLSNRLHAAFLSVPVTDRHTGFTFMDKTVYDCHNMPDSSALPWTIYLEYDFINPTQLQDLITKNSRLDQFTPPFSTHILRPHQCIQDVIATCSHAWSFQVDKYPRDSIESVSQKCSEVSAVMNLWEIYYQNRYCFYCNGGLRDRNYETYSRLHIGGAPERLHGLLILMSINPSGALRLTLNTPAHQVKGVKLSWERATCSLPSSVSQGSKTVGPTCSATCRVPFTLGSDGRCRAPHTSLVALAADHLPPCVTEPCPAWPGSSSAV